LRKTKNKTTNKDNHKRFNVVGFMWREKETFYFDRAINQKKKSLTVGVESALVSRN
jgi:hypothetical protein